MKLNDFIDDDDRDSDQVESSSDQPVEGDSTATETHSSAASRVKERAPDTEDFLATAERLKEALTVAFLWLAGALRGLIDTDDLPRSLDEVPLSSEQLKIVGAVTGLLLASTLAPMMLLPLEPSTPTGGDVAGTPEPKTGNIQTPEAGSYNAIPASHVHQTPSAPAPPEVSASAGSQTMQVRTAVQDSEPVLVLEDDQTHDGRWVSVPTSWLEEAYGDVPQMATIKHESGDIYAEELRVRGGQAVFFVQEFSTNTVEFSGEFSASLDPATDGSTISYDLNDVDSTSDPTVNLTGQTNTEWDNESGSFAPGNSLSISPAGNVQPVGPSGGEPEIVVTGSQLTNSDSNYVDSCCGNGGDTRDYAMGVSNINEITQLEVCEDYASDGTSTQDVYIALGNQDNDAVDGTLYFDNIELTAGGSDCFTKSVSIDVSNYDSVTWEFATVSNADSDGTTADWSLRSAAPSNVDVSAGGTTKSIGDLSNGQSVSKRFDLKTSDSSVSTTGSGGEVIMDVLMKERTVTKDPTVQLNSKSQNYTGTLNDGEETTLTFNSTELKNGTNTINVSLSSVSSDAPTSAVGLNYTHDAVDKQSVSYSAAKWTESYNVSKSYASSREQANLSIPFESDAVVSIRDIEYRINESGGWTNVISSEFQLDGTELVVDLDEVNGGPIAAGTTIEIRTDASKVTTHNGSISVTEPTVPGDALNTKFQVDSRDPGFYVGVGGSPDGASLHYLVNESWSSPDEYSIVQANGGNQLYLPNSGAGSTARVRTVPIQPAPLTGDVEVSVANTSSSEPAFTVREGESPNDDVQFTFEDAEDETEYVLWSKTNQVGRDSGTANSPLTLEDDDSSETLKFLIDDGGSTSSGGSDGGGGGGAPIPGPGEEGFVPNIVLLMIVFGTIAGIVVISRRDEEITNAGEETADGIEAAVKQVPVLGPGVGRPLAGLVQSASQLARFVLGNRTVALAMATGLGFGAIQAGLIQLPDGSLNAIILAAIGILSLFGLRELDLFTRERWAAIMLGSTLVTLQVTSQSKTSLLQSIVESQVWPVIAASGIYLAYKAVKAIQQPDEVTTVQIQTDGGQSEDEES